MTSQIQMQCLTIGVLAISDEYLLSDGIHILVRYLFSKNNPNQIFSVLRHAAACSPPTGPKTSAVPCFNRWCLDRLPLQAVAPSTYPMFTQYTPKSTPSHTRKCACTPPPWGNVCPARYFSINYPDFSPRFSLSWRSPPSRPRCTAHLPY